MVSRVASALVLGALLVSACSATHPALERAPQLDAEVEQLVQEGRRAEAIPKAREALMLREQVRGPNDPAVATSLNNLAELLRAQGDAVGARPMYERALLITEQALGPNHPNVERILNNLAELLRAQGDYAGAQPLYERVLRIYEEALGPTDPTVGTALNNLAGLLWRQGDYEAARPLYERALRIFEQARGPKDPWIATSLNNLAGLLEAQGEYAAARPLSERALRITEQALGFNHPDVATSLNNLALLLEAQRDYAAAWPLHERALRITEQALGPNHPDAGTSLNGLARLLEAQGDYAAARQMYERVLRIHEQALGPTHPTVATSLNNLALLRSRQKDYAGARPLYQRALRIFEQTLGPAHPTVGTMLNNLAKVLQAQGDYAAARPLYERALRIYEQALGPMHPTLGRGANNLGELLQAQGDYAAARPVHERALRIFEQTLAPTHSWTGASLHNLALLLEAQGDYARARSLYERARRLQLAAATANLDLDDEALRGLLRPPAVALRDYVGLLAAIARAPARDPTARDPTARAPAADAFLVAEQVRGQSAQRALLSAGTRAVAADTATANLVRQLQDLHDRRDATRRQLVAEYGRPIDRRDSARLGVIERRAETFERELVTAAERLRAARSGYGDLTAPEPIDVAATQQLLRPDEALVSLFVLEDRVLVWMLRRERALVYRDVEVRRSALQTLVDRVRRSLDQSRNVELSRGRFLPFDVAASHALFRLLLEPVTADLAGATHLLLVPDEVLFAIPFGVLVTKTNGDAFRRLAELAAQGTPREPAELAEYAAVSWLARDYAITVLPSATSLRTLRHIARAGGTASEPFIGFGDPILNGTGSRRGGPTVKARGSSVLEELRRLEALPGTRDQLHVIARALGTDASQALYLGARATKPQVIALDAAGRLRQARVVAFATHGLLAGEVKGLRQPALVLTLPPQVTPEDDGLLSLDDIATLKLLNADWVVLSGCNTATADGNGEGLTGLARAFAFTGAPTLLVSHWSGEDRGTQALMTEVFTTYARDRSIPRAEVLRQAMLAVMTKAQGSTAYLAHPFAWGRFFVLGEGH